MNTSHTCNWSTANSRMQPYINDSTIPEHWLNIEEDKVEDCFKESARHVPLRILLLSASKMKMEVGILEDCSVT